MSPEAFLELPVPQVVKPEFILPWTDPLQSTSPPLLETSGPLVTGADLPWSFDALQRYPWSCSLMRQAVHAHLGSALRLSQPLSGFCVDQVPRPYFMPQPFLDCLPSEPSPRRGRAPLSRSLLLPCSYPPCLEMRRQRPYHPRFHRLPRLSAVAWIPREL